MTSSSMATHDILVAMARSSLLTFTTTVFAVLFGTMVVSQPQSGLQQGVQDGGVLTYAPGYGWDTSTTGSSAMANSWPTNAVYTLSGAGTRSDSTQYSAASAVRQGGLAGQAAQAAQAPVQGAQSYPRREQWGQRQLEPVNIKPANSPGQQYDTNGQRLPASANSPGQQYDPNAQRQQQYPGQQYDPNGQRQPVPANSPGQQYDPNGQRLPVSANSPGQQYDPNAQRQQQYPGQQYDPNGQRQPASANSPGQQYDANAQRQQQYPGQQYGQGGNAVHQQTQHQQYPSFQYPTGSQYPSYQYPTGAQLPPPGVTPPTSSWPSWLSGSNATDTAGAPGLGDAFLDVLRSKAVLVGSAVRDGIRAVLWLPNLLMDAVQGRG